MVAVECAAPAVCLSKVWTRIEAGELGEWNKVITSLTPAWSVLASEQVMVPDTDRRDVLP